MKKIFKIFWVIQGCQGTPLKMSKTPIFRGVSWNPWVAQNFLNIFFIWYLSGLTQLESKYLNESVNFYHWSYFFYFDFNSIHTQIGFIKQILKRPADFQFLTQRRSETSFPNIFNQNFKEMDRPFKISKILQIKVTLLCTIMGFWWA